MITEEMLAAILPHARQEGRVSDWVGPINAALAEFEINTSLRMAAFLAQIAHESGELRYVREIASGKAYEGRDDLGNTQPGDGVRFKGRGLLQITGRSNYAECGNALGLDLLAHPELLEEPFNAARSAGWFWRRHHLNGLADAGDFAKITRKINGGLRGQALREIYYDRALRVLTPPVGELGLDPQGRQS
ncbi:MAG: glycoside hydrolase family 19 protein [Gammaproteobacteria bacterium]